MLQPLAITGAILGITSHLQVFKHGEWERHTPALAATYACAMAILSPIATLALAETTVYKTLLLVSTFWISYLAGLFASTGLYRVYFHPLRDIPGPLAAKLTALWTVKASIPDYKFHLKVQRLHEKHGDFIRIRPREISINHVDAIRDIHGQGTVCVKSPFYDINYPARSLQMTRDKAFHAKRRRIWDRGLGMKALATYEPRVLSHCADLLSQLSTQTRDGKPIEITQWINYFGFDVMGDVAFGESFNMVKSGKPDPTFSMLQVTRFLAGVFTCVPWTFILFKNIPVMHQISTRWIRRCATQVMERNKRGNLKPHLFTHLLSEQNLDAQSSSAKFPGLDLPADLVSDSELAIIAGSDTTSSTVSALIYLLATHPDKQALLQQELDTLFSGPDNISHQKLSASNAPFLEGCINEALRLYPAVPSGMQRMTPPEGAQIAGRWIPGDTIVSTPAFSLHRDPRNFPRPTSFIPERWSTQQSSLITHKEAFSPFLTGAYSCAGKALALMELRLLTALLFRKFTVRLHSHADTDADTAKERSSHLTFFDEQVPGWQDLFTAKVPAFEVLLEGRE
ncbi:hypothetical protein AJ79_03191 [Helicocarpus griseus UAMH5409]|uniref:Benzoate 4-monooxygenase cytochrome P450 n=1 Tax=Helicocarpus griseus UAMH5409 TaxID=1447875 RepID=A0A2B7Y078_9EURO|nr:hypothetical protein AJ79_03191 [Helicocarpus griseus UAMH5409]